MLKEKIFIFIFIIQSLIISIAHSSINQPLHDEVYPFIKRCVVKGIITETQLGNSYPYQRHRIAQALLEVYQKNRAGKCQLTKLEEAHLNRFLWLFQDEIEQDIPFIKRNQYLLTLTGEHYKIDVNPAIKQEFALDQNGETSITTADIAVYGKLGKWIDACETQHARLLFGSENYNPYANNIKHKLWGKNSWTLNSMHTYAVLSLPWFAIEGGVDDLWWGPGWHGALLLSDNSASRDLIKLSGNYGPIRFTYFTAGLPSEEKRYLTGHRLEIQPFSWINIGMAETVVQGYDYSYRYLNPLIVYLVIEPRAKDEYSNVLLSLDFDLILPIGLELYSELLIDDFQTSEDKPFEVWNSKLGILTGAYWADPLWLANTDLRMEYAALTKYVYTHRNEITTYQQEGFPIGHWLGCDADNLWVELKHWFTSNINGSISYEMERHGEGKLKAYDYDQLFKESAEWEFLSGTTESTHSISLGASYNLIGRYSLDLQYIHSWLKNASNQAGADDTNVQVLLSGQYRF